MCAHILIYLNQLIKSVYKSSRPETLLTPRYVDCYCNLAQEWGDARHRDITLTFFFFSYINRPQLSTQTFFLNLVSSFSSKRRNEYIHHASPDGRKERGSNKFLLKKLFRLTIQNTKCIELCNAQTIYWKFIIINRHFCSYNLSASIWMHLLLFHLLAIPRF